MTAIGTNDLAIDAENVARRFETTWVLRGVNLRLSAGEVVGLLGANGTGKSTLLRIVATLLRPLPLLEIAVMPSVLCTKLPDGQ